MDPNQPLPPPQEPGQQYQNASPPPQGPAYPQQPYQQPGPYNPQPNVQPITAANNPYDFILNHDKPRRSFLPAGKSKQERMLIFGAGLAGLLIIIAIVTAVLLSGGSSDSQALLAIAQQQNELIRVSNLGGQKARSNLTLSVAKNTELSMTTAQKQNILFLSKLKKKVGTKDLSQSKNAKTDQALSSAQLSGTYDEALIAELKKELTAYRSSVEQQFKNTSSKQEKALLKSFYDQATILLNSIDKPSNVSA